MVLAATIGACWLVACSDGGDPAGTPPPTGTPNQRPTAVVAVDVDAGRAPVTVQFDGTGSTDPDGQIQSYAWSFGDGATGSGATTTHTYTVPGIYTATLTVTDDRGATATDSDSVTVETPIGAGTNTIEGTVWYDVDGDGVRDAGDDGLEGFRLYLDDNGNGAWDPAELSTLTDAGGAYSFGGVDSTRAYSVRQELTFGWTNTSATTSPNPTSSQEPDLPLVATRVVGGEDAGTGEFPFQVALLLSSRPDPANAQFCGGSLIAARWVLTAAHCVEGSQPQDVDILIGTNNLSAGGERIEVTRIRIFPDYGVSQGIDNDLALLEIDRDLMTRRIALLSPAELERAAPGTMATVVGWGLTEASGSATSILQKGTMAILSNQECATAYPDLTDAMICTSQVGGVDACNGDSGGPLAVAGPLGWLQVGIVSFGLRCAAFPGVYARVSSLYDYVAATVPAEPSRVVDVVWNAGETRTTVDFGNFR